jgi:hypothetical protein
MQVNAVSGAMVVSMAARRSLCAAARKVGQFEYNRVLLENWRSIAATGKRINGDRLVGVYASLQTSLNLAVAKRVSHC